MSYLKVSVAALTEPLMVALLLAVVAGVVAWRGRRRAAIGFLGAALIVVCVTSTGVVGDWLLNPLEARYPPLQDYSVPPVRWIVVLGSSYAPRDGISITAALDHDALVRIVEGVRLTRLNPGVKLLVSGGAADARPRPAQGYAELARDLGVDRSSIVLSDDALDTDEEARDVVKLVGGEQFILVTSAYHMPRAMRLMRLAGARPIAAPTGQLVTTSFRWRSLLPSSAGLGKSERAVHEYLGFLAMVVGVH
jgi:uncharacterized SAM-binding protein YcdF (DUF218 family)